MSAAAQSLAQDVAWWISEHDDDRAQRIAQFATAIWRDQSASRTEMVRNARMYSSVNLLGLAPNMYRRSTASTRQGSQPFNVVKAVCDTYVALLTDDKPKVTYQTSGGDWSLQRKAKLLEQFTDGIFYDADLYETAPRVALDAAVFRLGIVKVVADERHEQPRIKIERVLPWTLLVDDQEAYDGNPQTIYQIIYWDRLALAEEFPDHKEKIEQASCGDFAEWGVSNFDLNLSSKVVVIEAWHLPRSGESGDGRRTLICGDAILEDVEYKNFNFPFEWLSRLSPTCGIWGEAIPDELLGIQRSINHLTHKIELTHHLLASGHWLVEQSSQITTGHLNNAVGGLIKYRGVPPQFFPGGDVPPGIYAHLDRLYSRAFEIIGVSQQVAQSQKPAGLNSGKALLVYGDIQSKRFQPSFRLYSAWFKRIARQCIRVARELSERHPDFAVKATGAEMMRVVKWADANLRDEEFLLKQYTTNELADEPAGKLEIVQMLANAGLIMDKADVFRLLDLPDMKTYGSYKYASYDLVMSLVDRMIEGGEYIGPEPEMDFTSSDNVIGHVQNAYLKAKRDHVPEDRLELLQRWLEAAVQIKNAKAPAAPANSNGAVPVPGGGPPPVNDNGAPPMAPPGMPVPA